MHDHDAVNVKRYQMFVLSFTYAAIDTYVFFISVVPQLNTLFVIGRALVQIPWLVE